VADHPRHSPVHRGLDWGDARDSRRASGEAIAARSVRGHDGLTRFPARRLSQAQRQPKWKAVMKMARLYPYTLAYIAFMVTLAVILQALA
jgi:hypothetical protein